jgi:TonB-linked SusC/RagA family outer membrane protein
MTKTLRFRIVFVLMLFSGALWAQTRTVSGKVTMADDGSAAPGVNVVLKGTTNGTTTDGDGNYKLSLPNEGGTLVFSFIGLATQEVIVGDRTIVDVSMTSDTKQLSEVVVVGYGSTTKEAYTGTAKVVSADNISKKNVPNISRALMGEVAGVQVLNTSGQPGTIATVRIRGFGSANGNRDPLYVVDGVPLTEISVVNSINPSDIESTVVLKDATATAIYGTRGANGVILINTKSGKGTNSYVELDAQVGTNFAALPRYSVIKSPDQYIGLGWESIYNEGVIKGATAVPDPTAYANSRLFGNAGIANNYNMWLYNGAPATGAQLIDPTTRTVNSGITHKYTPEDWGKYAFKPAQRNQFDVKFGGSNSKTNYYTSLGYLGDKGYSINSNYNRFTARFNLNHEVYKWLRTAMNVGFNRSEQNYNGQSNDSGSIFWFADNNPSIYPLFLKDPATGQNVPDPIFGGSQFDYGIGRGFGALTNSVGDATYDINRNVRYEVNGNFAINFDIIKGLTSENRFGFQYYDNKQINRGNKFYGNSASQNGDLYNQITQMGSYNLLNLLRYQKTFGDHNLQVMAAHEATNYESQILQLDKYNLVDPNILDYNNGIVTNPISGYTNSYSLESYFGQATYDYKGTYFFSGSVRSDGSSRFPNNKWGTFGSVGGGWIVSNENFMKNQSILNFLKLKASYGITGDQGANSSAGYYPGYDLYDVNNLNNKPAFSFSSKGNPNITWETSKMFQAGIEFNMGKYLTGTFDFYQKNTSNLFFTRGVGASAGYSTILVNDGNLRNQGFEFDLTGHILKTKDYFIDLGLNGDIFNNKLTKMPIDPATGKEKVIDNSSDPSGLYGWSTGHSIYDFYIRESAGVKSSTGQAQWTQYYNDVNGNGVVDPGEAITSLAPFQAANPSLPEGQLKTTTTTTFSSGTLVYSGKSAIPKVKGAINLRAGYKGIELSVQMLYSFGGYGFDAAYQSLMHSGKVGSNNWSTDILNRWQKDGDATDVPRLSNGQDASQNGTSTRFLVKSDFLLLNNVRLMYTFPTGLISSLKIKSASIWISGDNLWTHSKRQGYNPFISQDGRSSQYTYAPLSTISGGIKVKF